MTQQTVSPELDEARRRLDETIATLREQLQTERQAYAEGRRIIAGLAERMPPAIEPPAPESSSEERGSSVTSTPEVGGGGVWQRPVHKNL